MESRTLFALIFVFVTVSSSTVASERSTLTFAADNDGIFRVDQDYTNGIFTSYTSTVINTPSILMPLSLSTKSALALDKVEFTIGHKIWTPSDIKSTKPVANDRPYAGYFYTEFNFLSLNSQQAQRVNLTLGVTGKYSFADKAQTLVHSITASEEPNGWEYQIADEVVGGIGYLTHFNLSRHAVDTAEFEIANITEVNIGGFRSDVSTGIMLRWGMDLSENMGAANIATEHSFRPGMIGASNSAWFIFTGIEGRYRFNDMTIEGKRPNIPESEYYPSTLENWQSSAVFGAAWYNKYAGMSITLAAKTADYKEAKTALYGNAGLSLFAFL